VRRNTQPDLQPAPEQNTSASRHVFCYNKTNIKRKICIC